MTNSTDVERGRLRARLAFLALSTILCSGLAAPALAESAHSNLDANGVDLVDGSFNLRLPVASIGSGQAALPLMIKDSQFDNWSGINIYRTVSGGVTTITVNLARGYDRFTSTDGFATSKLGTGATLSVSDESMVYSTLEGTVIAFGNPSPNDTGGTSKLCDTYNAANCYLLPQTIDGRGGMTVSYAWTVVPNCARPANPDDPVNCSEYWRLGSVSNDAGYAIGWSYVNASGPPVAAWFQRSTATLTNGNVSAASWPTVSYAYPSSTVMTVTTPGGKTWRITGIPGTLTGVRRPSASSDTMTISYSGGVVSAVTSDGVTTSYNRSVSGSTGTTIVTDAQGHASTIVADLTKQRVTSVTDPLGHVTTMSYDGVGRAAEIAYPEGNRVQYGYDGRGNLTTTTQVAKGGSGLANIVTSANYASSCVDAACNEPITTTDARGNVTNYAYDGTTGLVTTVTAPAPTSGATRPETRYSYTTVSGVAVVTGVSTCQTGAAPSCVGTADEVKTAASYNTNLLPTSVSRGAGDTSLSATTAATYDAIGNLLTVDGPLAGTADTTTLRWSADRERLGVISPDPDGSGALKRRAVKTTYNADGQPTVREVGTVNGTSDSDWSAFVSLQQATTTYDGNARATRQVTTAGGTTYGVVQYNYDAVGRLECTALRMNSGAWGSLPGSACTLGTTGSFGPDRIAKTTYDAAGQPTKVQSAFGTADQSDDATSSYNANGTTATLTDAQNNTTTYEYDGFDRLTSTRYPVATAGAGTSSTTDFRQPHYDANGNVTSLHLRDGQMLYYTYDALNRRTYDDNPGTNVAEADVTTTYDNLGRVTRAQDANGWYAAYVYDALGRAVQESSNLYANAYQYDPAGRLTRQSWADGFYVNYDHLVTGEVSAIRESGATSGVGVLASYGYDDLGRRTSIVRGNGTTTSYGYDTASRLTALSHDVSGSAYDISYGYSYNPAGQIVSRTSSNDAYAWGGSANRNDASSINGLNQVTSVGAGSLGYDTRGNLTSNGGSTTFTYNTRNHLFSDNSGDLLYRGPNGLLGQLLFGSGGTNLDNARGYLATEFNSTSGATLRRYVFGPGDDEPLVWYEGSGTSDRRWLHADERGSVVATSNASGTVTAINSYDEYGVPGSGNVGRFQYTGQKYIPELGLYDYKARMYSSRLGRFLQTDPIGYGDGMNWYSYVGADPVNFRDPFGLENEGTFTVTAKSCDSGQALTATRDPNDGNGYGYTCVSYGRDFQLYKLNEEIGGRFRGYGDGDEPVPQKTQPGRHSVPCSSLLNQDGHIFARYVSGTAVVGGGVTGGYGRFSNLANGATGHFYTVGGAAGYEVTGGGSVTIYNSLNDLNGFAASLNVQLGPFSGALNFNTSGFTAASLGLTLPTGVGANAAATGTRLFGCTAPD